MQVDRPESQVIVHQRRRLTVGLILAVLVVVHVRYPLGPAGQATYLGATVGGAVLALTGLFRRSIGRQWRWLAAGVALSAIGDVVFWAYSALFHRAAPDSSWADPPWLLSYLALGIGISGILGLRGSRTLYRNLDAVVDMLGAAIVGLLAVWVLALQPTMNDSTTALGTRLLWSTYPILDVATLAVLVGGILVCRRRSLSTVLLCCGVGCWLVSDFGFVAVGTTTVDISVWLDIGWMVGATLLGLAVWEGISASSRDAEREVDRVGGRVRLAAGIAPLLVPSALAVWSFARGDAANPWPLAVATAALAYLAFVRCERFLRAKDRAAVELDGSERYYRTLAANSSDAVLVISRSGHILRESSTFARLAALKEPIVGTDITSLPFIVDPELIRDIIVKAALVPGQPIAEELLVRDARRGERWFALRVMDMVHDDNVGGVVVNIHDTTERKHVEQELRTQAFHDSLTGLANRALFRDRVGHVLESRGRTGIDPAVAFLDLDEFKYINDTLGHDAGDQLLRTVADRLLLAVRPGDTVARLGGDEFAVLIESPDRGADAASVAERVLESLRQPIDIAGRSHVISCSIGIAYADEGSDTSSLLRHADMAMYEAKSNGKDRWAMYDPAMGQASRERMNLAADLRDALTAGQFEVVYQPIYTISSGTLSGFEALLRWSHPTAGPISPERFVPDSRRQRSHRRGRRLGAGRGMRDSSCLDEGARAWRDRALDGSQRLVGSAGEPVVRRLGRAHASQDRY